MIKRLGPLFCLLFLWWGITHTSNIPSFLLPPPEDVALSFLNHGSTIALHTAFSLIEVLISLGISLATSLIFAFIFARQPSWTKPTLQVLTALQVIPVFALLPLLLLWMGHGIAPKIFIISVSCFFPMTIGALNGLQRIPASYHDLSFLFRAHSLAKFRHIELPAILPYLMTGIRLAAVHAPITVIAADWIGATQGLGYLIMLASGRLQVDLLFAGIICLITISLCLNKGCNILYQKLIYWPSES